MFRIFRHDDLCQREREHGSLLAGWLPSLIPSETPESRLVEELKLLDVDKDLLSEGIDVARHLHVTDVATISVSTGKVLLHTCNPTHDPSKNPSVFLPKCCAPDIISSVLYSCPLKSGKKIAGQILQSALATGTLWFRVDKFPSNRFIFSSSVLMVTDDVVGLISMRGSLAELFITVPVNRWPLGHGPPATFPGVMQTVAESFIVPASTAARNPHGSETRWLQNMGIPLETWTGDSTRSLVVIAIQTNHRTEF